MLRVAWLPHSTNPVFAGVRLRCLIPSQMLRSPGLTSSVCADIPAGPAEVLVVQAKWLLDASSGAALTKRARQIAALRKSGTRLVLDLFDNYFLNASGDARRAELLTAFRQTFRAFDAFTVSSTGLLPFVRAEVGPQARIFVIGDPVEGPGANRIYEGWARRCNPRRWSGWLRHVRQCADVRRRRRMRPQLIWFGNHSSSYAVGGMEELRRVIPDLAAASQVQPFSLTVASNSREHYLDVVKDAGFDHRYVDWDRVHFASLLACHDLVLLPASSTHFAVAKSNNRLLLPLSLNVPVIADMLPDYQPWSGFCAHTPWSRLPGVLQNLATHKRIAAEAVGPIASEYSPQAVGGKWLEALQEVARCAPGGMA